MIRTDLLLALVLGFASQPGLADSFVVLEGREGQPPQKNKQLIPYAFYNENTETAVASAFVAQGYGQPQMNIVLNGFTSSNDSHNVFYLFKDIQCR